MAEKIYEFCIKIIGARNLDDVSTNGNLDPFVKLTYGSKSYQSTVLRRGGPNPTWNYELCLWGDQKTLTIGVYDYGRLRTKLIGEHVLDLSTMTSEFYRLNKPLYRSNNGGKECGELNFIIHFSSNTPEKLASMKAVSSPIASPLRINCIGITPSTPNLIIRPTQDEKGVCHYIPINPTAKPSSSVPAEVIRPKSIQRSPVEERSGRREDEDRSPRLCLTPSGSSTYLGIRVSEGVISSSTAGSINLVNSYGENPRKPHTPKTQFYQQVSYNPQNLPPMHSKHMYPMCPTKSN